jgi:hypothetical protein
MVFEIEWHVEFVFIIGLFEFSYCFAHLIVFLFYDSNLDFGTDGALYRYKAIVSRVLAIIVVTVVIVLAVVIVYVVDLTVAITSTMNVDYRCFSLLHSFRFIAFALFCESKQDPSFFSLSFSQFFLAPFSSHSFHSAT